MSDPVFPGPHDQGVPRREVFDPAAETLPAGLGEAGPGAVTLLLDTAMDRGWAADAAITLASAWGREGRRIVLADLHLDEPILHERIGGDNLDGVVDIFLYGASLARSARPVPGRDFYLIPAGTYTPEMSSVFAHPRWSKLVAGFRDAHASLLLFARGDSPDIAPLLRWAGQVVVLGEGKPAHELPADLNARAILVPPPGARDIEIPDRTFEAEELDRTLEAGIDIAVVPAVSAADDTLDAEPADPGEVALEYPPDAGFAPARFDDEVAGDVPAPDPDSHPDNPTQPVAHPSAPHGEAEEDRWIEPAEPARVSRRGSRGRGPAWLVVWVLIGIAVLLVIGYLVASATGVLTRGSAPGTVVADGTEAGVDTNETDGSAPLSPAVSASASGPLPHAVQVRAFTSFEMAREHIAMEERRLPGIPFYISPERVRGTLYYKVLAGLPVDTAAALSLRDRLVDAGSIDPAGAGLWMVRHVPFAFDLGQFPTRNAAEIHGAFLRTRGVPVYLVARPDAGGSEGWQLYAGAFHDSARAGVLREFLERAGVRAELVERVGQPVAPAADAME